MGTVKLEWKKAASRYVHYHSADETRKEKNRHKNEAETTAAPVKMSSEQEEKGEEDVDEDEKERKEENRRERRERRRKKRAAEVEELTSAGHQALKQGQAQEALQLFRRALKAASQLGESRVVSACCLNLGAVLVETGDPESGLDYLGKAQPGSKSQRLPDLQFNLALAHNALGERQKAVEHFLQAAQLYSSQGNSLEEGHSCWEMSRCHALDKEHSLAISGYLRAAESYRVANMQHSAAVALKEAASHMVQAESSPSDVTKVLSDCLSLTDSITDQSILGELYLSVGVVFCQVRSFQEAVQCFQKALSPASQLQERPLLAKVLLNLGAALNAVGEFKAALEYHRLAAKLYGSLGLRGQQAQCFSNLALACRHLGNDEEAIESFNHALQGFTDSEEHSAQVQVCEALAEVYLKQRKQHKAIQLYRQALLSLSHCQDSEGVGQRLVERLTAALRITVAQRPRPFGQIRPHPLSPLSRRLDTPSPTKVLSQQRDDSKGEGPSEPWSDRELHTDSEVSLVQKTEDPPPDTPDSVQTPPLLKRLRSRFCSLM
ncbi:tetratricopeptide repeat protein 24 [Periophthalmus magnuspinnatus]|uniref:tetratricopeptide repeat protein 24 n=1 Tax=Periophthalmus magnuspinnatus TaxID=409849 RepID=UPI0024363AF0|nr:tetratricopeptide repeat protein 24 [Periophthalmus magnuspinnatus]